MQPIQPDADDHRVRRQCDVVVIGGGPAGSTSATLLARRGWSVTLLERAPHPRFHIGESLLPMNLPLFEHLGVLAQVTRIGVHKPAADFTGRDRHDHQTFAFARALGATPDHAFQVRRAEFDALLFDNCRQAGAEALEGWQVTAVALHARRGHRVTAHNGNGETREWHCRYVVDASGQDTVLARQQGWRERDRRHSAAAFFAHFENVPARPAPWSGNISIYWFEWGWIWMIPLQEGLTSVGAVCSSEHARRRGDDLEAYFCAVLASCPAAAERLHQAQRVTPVRTAANYSYASRRQTGPGFALVGDAYTFVDPVFSSGVYLAMSSAFALSGAADHWLRGRRLRYRLATFAYRRRVRRGVRAFKWFIYRFNTPAMSWLFENPRDVLGAERAVVSLLAGDVYDHPWIRVRLLVFKALYALVSAVQRWTPGCCATPATRAILRSCR